MTLAMKLQYHLEIVIYQEHPGVPFNARQIEALMARATPAQIEAAYQRALTHCPLLLDDERRPE